jgi:hypothetical protein
MKLKYQEMIIDCIPGDSGHEQPSCIDCGKVAYQTLVVSFAGTSQRVPLCGVHFIHAWAEYPELRKLDALLRTAERSLNSRAV